MSKKEILVCKFEIRLKKKMRSNLINDSLISAYRPGLKIGAKNDIFRSTKRSGFGQERAHPQHLLTSSIDR